MPHFLTALEAARRIREGQLRSEDLVRACLDRIAQREPLVHAFAFLDPDLALGQARAADEARRQGQPLGPLHGVPMGVKDVFDTFDQPTQCGSPLFAGNQPQADSRPVALLRQAGAVILGKTVTNELATPTPGPTRNPLNPERTPGGSSAGSGAAVADHMVPLAIGTQTKASVLRPAAYCGVVGYKPTHGLIPRSGVIHQSWVLDQVGGLARTVEDAALLAQCMMGYDPEDPDSRPVAVPDLVDALHTPFPGLPKLLFVKGTPWASAQPGIGVLFEDFVESLRSRHRLTVDEKDLPPKIDQSCQWIDTLLGGDLAHNYGHLYRKDKSLLSPALRTLIEEGQRVPVTDYLAAAEEPLRVARRVAAFMAGYDAIITLTATGEADTNPERNTGNSIFCAIWNFAGLPSISLPLLTGPAGLPVGVQLIAPRGQDRPLLRVARRLMELCAARS